MPGSGGEPSEAEYERVLLDNLSLTDSEKEEEEEPQPAHGNRARESTSNESGVFSECPEHEPTHHHYAQ